MNETLIISGSLKRIYDKFSKCFTKPSFENFIFVFMGFVMNLSRSTISGAVRMIRAFGFSKKHFGVFYKFFSLAQWSLDELGYVVCDMALYLIPGSYVIAPVDDSFVEKSGNRIFGGGMHYNAMRSNYSSKAKGAINGRKIELSFGLNFVFLSLWVPLPWNHAKGIAIPILFRLYRSKKSCPKSEYEKRTKLAKEMIDKLMDWLPQGRKLIVVGDYEYSCTNVIGNDFSSFTYAGTLRWNAKLYDFPQKQKIKRRGPPCKKGERLPSLEEILGSPQYPWQKHHLPLYGKQVEIWIKTFVCLWYGVCKAHPVRVVLTKDPKNIWQPKAYICTDSQLSADKILMFFSKRWSLEICFREVKQSLLHVQNGWGRISKGKKRKKKSGPQPLGKRGEQATKRTIPFLFLVYSIVYLWYLRYGNPQKEVSSLKKICSWYSHKEEPSFADAMWALRLEIVEQYLSNEADPVRFAHNLPQPFWMLLRTG